MVQTPKTLQLVTALPHFYADDIRAYGLWLSLIRRYRSFLYVIHAACTSDVASWMQLNGLHLNSDKKNSCDVRHRDACINYTKVPTAAGRRDPSRSSSVDRDLGSTSLLTLHRPTQADLTAEVYGGFHLGYKFNSDYNTAFARLVWELHGRTCCPLPLR